MGFFSGLLGDTPSVNVPASGFYAQPSAYQNLYKNTVGAANNTLFNPNRTLNTNLFTAAPTNQFETNAQNLISQGVTPTAQSLQSDISMLTNPFDESVIGGINREATGQNSLVNQAATLAGQQGSNRSFLGTSDVEQNRLNNIGQFKQSQYNTAINQALGPLANLRQQDITNNAAEGQTIRGIDTQNQQAPLAALQAALAALTGTPTSFGNFGTQAAQVGGSGPTLGGVLNTAGTVASIASMFSDEDLKENVEPKGIESGWPVYEFNYIGDDKRYVGVMAQDVVMRRPDAVTIENGFYKVDYNKIGMQMRLA